MARQRVVFISGIGAFVPGQISNPSDAQNYIQGLGTIASGNPATNSQSGVTINPAINAASSIIAAAGGISSGLGALGVPQNIQNLLSTITNTGGIYIELFLNPQRIKEEHDKTIIEIPTADGYGELHFGNKLAKLRFELITRNLRQGSTSASQQSAVQAQQNLDQLKKFYQVNNFNVGLIYQNQIYVGHFEGPFAEDRDAANPNIISYNFTFKIDKLPQVSLPGLGTFNVNQIPFSL